MFPVVCGTCRIVRGADINDVSVDAVVRHGQKIIFFVGVDVGDVSPVHDIGVHIYRVYRVGNQRHVLPVKKIGDISGITFGTVRYEYFIGVDRYIVLAVIIDDRTAQEFISLLGTVAFECVGACERVDTLMKLCDDLGAKGERHVADTEADHFPVGIRRDVGIDAVGNL